MPKVYSGILGLVIFSAILIAPAAGQDNSGDGSLSIITPPAVEEGIIYFVHWPETVYAFNETLNELRWSAALEPASRDIDPAALPAPPPVAVMSYVLVHLGSQLWGVSKIDGHTVWHVDGLPEASNDAANSSSNPLPGYYVFENDTEGSVITLEQENGFWFCRRRMLGNGNLAWESRINGDPRAWWLDHDKLFVVYELFGASGPGPGHDNPAVISKLDTGTGDIVWSTPVHEDASFRAAFRALSQSIELIYILRKIPSGEYEISSYNEETGEEYRTVKYAAGDFIKALASDDKLVILHCEGDGERRQVRFLLYFSSLNLIRDQVVRESRSDLLFPAPGVDGNLFLYGGNAYSLYDGKIVWQEALQRYTVDWAADDYRIYVWDSSGFIQSLDRLTGMEQWRTPFSAVNSDTLQEPGNSGLSLILTDNRLFAATPLGELVRLDPNNGDIHPGILRVTHSGAFEGSDQGKNTGERPGGNNTWLWMLIAVAAMIGGFFLWFGIRKPVNWGVDDDDGRKST